MYRVTYNYTESGVTQRCSFVCHATSVRGAAENFWNQHPGQWFQLISVNNGSIEAFWSVEHGTFYTVPGRDDEVGL